jgi:predicted site-specific integrase-resolvase
MYISYATIRKEYDIGRSTLSGWSDQDRLRVKRMPGGKRLYHDGDIRSILGDSDAVEKKQVAYARVSSSKQKEDLQRQIEFLKQHYPEHEIVFDIGSGLNYKRRKFTSILERVCRGEVSEIVVTYSDRLCRYGFELVQWICSKNGTKILVHNKGENLQSPESELAEDLLSVCNFFVARNNGRRASTNRKRREVHEDEEDNAKSNKRTKRDAKAVVRGGKVDVQQMSGHVPGEEVSTQEEDIQTESDQQPQSC